jgi:hypothetical protein
VFMVMVVVVVELRWGCEIGGSGLLLSWIGG